MHRDSLVRFPLLLLAVGTLLVAATALGHERSSVADATAQGDFNSTAVTYNGEVAQEDFTVQFRGQASGAQEVVFVLVGASGAVVAERGATGAGGSFDRNVPLEGVDRRLNPGRVRAITFTPGRDGVYGAGDEAPETSSDLVDFVYELGAERLSQAQILERLRRATVDAPGSDDLASTSEFALAPANTRITEVSRTGNATVDGRQFEPGERILVRGVTNRRPDQNSIDVSVGQGPSAGEFEAPIINQWGTDGAWNTTIAVPADVRPGNYTVRAFDGDSRDTVQIRVVERRAQAAPQAANETGTANATTATPGPAGANATTAETPGQRTTTTTTATTTTQMATTTATTTTTTATTTPSPTPTATTTPGQPGFGVLVAVLAGLLAVTGRRRLTQR